MVEKAFDLTQGAPKIMRTFVNCGTRDMETAALPGEMGAEVFIKNGLHNLKTGVENGKGKDERE